MLDPNSCKIHVFSDEEPFDLLEIFDIEPMRDGKCQKFNVTASGSKKSLYLSTEEKNFIWRIHIPKKKIDEFYLTGQPYSLSTTSSDDLLVTMHKNLSSVAPTALNYWHLDICSSSDGHVMKSIPLPIVVDLPFGALETPRHTFIISYQGILINQQTIGKSVWLLSEITINGNILRSFNPPNSPFINYNMAVAAITMNGKGEIYLADYNYHRIILLNSQMTMCQILLQAKRPTSILYVKAMQMLVYGLLHSDTSDGRDLTFIQCD